MIHNSLTTNVELNNSIHELYMTFSLSNKKYSILADKISEIVQLPKLTVLETMPNNLIGLMNIRGKVISVVDIRSFLGFEINKYSADHQVLIVNTNGKTLGIIVDSVNNVIQFDKKNVESLPYESNNKHIEGIYNFEDEMIALIDLNSIVENIEQTNFENTDLKKIPFHNVELFPNDIFSREKFEKRALDLQKEIKVDLDKNDYIQDRFVSFSLNSEIYCISLKYVKEFTKLKNITLTVVPCVPEFIAGLINLRGEFITIIDIKSFLQIAKTELTDKTKIIVVKTQNLQIGLLVDEVYDIVNIPLGSLNKDSNSQLEKDKFTSGEFILEKNKVMSILNLEKLLEDERLYFEDAI